jgi:regulator of protease activity HflC (stomatin/prohibitin superfamily)
VRNYYSNVSVLKIYYVIHVTSQTRFELNTNANNNNNSNTKDNVSVNIGVTTMFRIMGDEKREEDPQNVYRFVHEVTARGAEDQLRSAQVRIIHINYS